MTKLVEGKKLRKGLKKGIDKLANVVQESLGPKGNTVIIRTTFDERKITKDGVSIAKEIFLEDPIENLGSEMVKEVALKSNDLAGDGTTTATVLARAIYTEGIKSIEHGATPTEYYKGLKKASEVILNEISKSKIEIDTESEMLKSIALVSSNGDENIAKTITKIYKDLGTNAVIHAIQGNGMETTVNVVKGMQFDRGYLSPYCVTDTVKMKAEFENPFIFLYDGKITDFKTVLPAIEIAAAKARPLIVVAENVQENALRGLGMNHVQSICQSAVVSSPGYGKKRVERLKDMGVLFGAKVFDKDSDMTLFDISHLGEMDNAEITATDTALIGGRGEEKAIKEREAHLKAMAAHHKGNKYEMDIIEERLGKLTSGVAVIKVGAHSHEEGKEIFDRVEDCKHAVKAALLEGIVAGGGMALYNVKEIELNEDFENVSDSFIDGYKSLFKTVNTPFKQILLNANKIPELISSKFDMHTRGYDVKNEEYVDSMIDAGIIDPFKVVRIALESAVSIVGTLLTSNYAIINSTDETVKTFRN